MKRSLVTTSGLVAFTGGATTRSSFSSTFVKTSKVAEIAKEIRVRSRLSSFMKSL